MTVLRVVHLPPEVRPGPLQAGDAGPVGRPGVDVVPGQEAGEQGQHQGTQPGEGEAVIAAHGGPELGE